MTYAYDNVGRLATLAYGFPNSDYNTTLQFQYSEANQIVWKEYSNNSYDWFPAASDTHITYALDGLNRVTNAGQATINYDGKGEITGDGAGGVFGYNSHNWMTSATPAGGAAASLTYDALGRLYSVAQGSTTTQFLYDGSDIIAEYDGSGNLLRRYAHGGWADEAVAWLENAQGTYNGRNYPIPERPQLPDPGQPELHPDLDQPVRRALRDQHL